jgi:hypothetical protein
VLQFKSVARGIQLTTTRTRVRGDLFGDVHLILITDTEHLFLDVEKRLGDLRDDLIRCQQDNIELDQKIALELRARGPDYLVASEKIMVISDIWKCVGFPFSTSIITLKYSVRTATYGLGKDAQVARPEFSQR